MASVPDPRPAREATSQQHEFMLSWLSHACEEHRGKHGVIKGVWLVAIRQPDGWDVEKEKKEAKYEWKWMEVEYKTDQQQKDLRKRFPQHVELPKYIKMLTDPGLIAKLGQVAVLICDFTIGIDKFQFLQLISEAIAMHEEYRNEVSNPLMTQSFNITGGKLDRSSAGSITTPVQWNKNDILFIF